MLLKSLSLAILLFYTPHHLYAQNKHKDNGYLIYTLGSDTTMIGYYDLDGDDFAMTVVVRTILNVHKVKGSFFPNGELKYAEGYTYRPVAGKDSLLVQTYKLYTKDDSTILEQKRGDNLTIQRYPVRAMATNSLGNNSLVFLPALLANYAPSKNGDSIVSTLIVLGTPRKFVMKRIDDKTLIAGSDVMGFFKLHLNEKGKVKSVDAIGSSWNIKGTVLPYLNMDSVIRVNAYREQQYGPIGSMIKLDSVQTTIDNVSIKIKYSRPSVRGRVIFGEVVPWNRFWRTGANAATKITLSHPVYINNNELPAGEYSIFTMPSQNEWTIMFNREANIWGTDYKPANDFLNTPLQTEQLKEPVEMLTIEIVSADDGGVINIIWEKMKAYLKFKTSK